MADVVKRESGDVEPAEFFERMFDDWFPMPVRRPWALARRLGPEDVIRVDEHEDGEALVVEAELPGIDPDKDVEITVDSGRLHIQAERREEERKEAKGYRRRELRYGSVSRSLSLPPAVKESDVTATYRDGLIGIRIPTARASATKIPVFKS